VKFNTEIGQKISAKKEGDMLMKQMVKTESEINIKTKRKDSFPTRILKQWDLQVMAIPSMILLIIFCYIPMWGVLMSFQEYNLFKGFTESPWVGLMHFRMLFNAPEFPIIMRNTLVISMLRLVFGFPAPIILALMFNEIKNQTFKRTVQTVTYMPHFISWVVVSGFVFNVYGTSDGIINNVLKSANLISRPIEFLTSPQYFWAILVSTGIWKDVGFSAIIYLAAIAGIDPSLYEAANVDGASKLQKIFHITLPSIAPTIIILLILAIGNILNSGFQDILLLTNNGNNAILTDVATNIDIYVFKQGLTNMRYSYATAAGLFKSVVNVVLLGLANYTAKKVNDTSLW
jgi:putative aldouronate transport system permease protein